MKGEELKPKHRQIIDFIKRRKVEWVSTTAIAMGTFTDHYTLVKNLKELEKLGILESQRNFNRFTYWKLIK